MDPVTDVKVNAGDAARPKEKKHRPAKEHRPHKMKKGHKALLALTLIFLIIIATPVALVYGLFFDNSPVAVAKLIDEDFDMDDYIDSLFYASLEQTEEKKAIRFEIDEKTLNNLLDQYIGKEVRTATKDIVDGVYIDIDPAHHQYHIILTAGVPAFRTKLSLDIDLDAVINDPEYGDYYLMEIADLRLGRCGGIYDLLMQIVDATGLMKKYNLADMLKDFGFHPVLDLENQRLIYPKDKMIEDIMAKFDLNDNTELQTNLLKGFFELNMERLDLYSTTKDHVDTLAAEIDLTDTDTNPDYCTPDKDTRNLTHIRIDNPKAADKTEFGLIQVLEAFYNKWGIMNDEGKKKDNEKFADALFNYLIRGHDGYTYNKNISKGETPIDLDDLLKPTSEFINSDKLSEFYDWFNTSKLRHGRPKIYDFKEYPGLIAPPVPFDVVTTKLEELITNKLDNICFDIIKNFPSLDFPTHLEGTLGDTPEDRISEDDINQAMRSTEVIGYTFLAQKRDGDKRYFNYITITDFYMNITENDARVVLGCDLNGRKMSICLPAEKFKPENMKKNTVNFKIGDAYLGKKLIRPILQEYINKLAIDAINNDGREWSTYDKENNYFSFDFQDIIKTTLTNYKPDTLSGYGALDAWITSFIDNLKIELVADGEDLDAIGHIDLKYSYDQPADDAA